MCTLQAIKKGFRDIGANKGTVLLVWLINLILALAIAFPAFGWLTKMDHSVGAEQMLNGFSLPVLFDLFQYDFSTVLRLMGTLFFWMIVCGLLLGTFLSGGLLSVLAARSPQFSLERFFAGAGRHFPAFLALLVVAGIFGGIVLFGLNVVLGIAVAHLSEDASELTPLLLGLGQLTVATLVGTVFLLALHYARIDVVLNGTTGLIRTYGRALLFVFRNLVAVFALIVFFSLLAGLTYLLYWGTRSVLPTTTWLLILLLITIQQLAALARSAFQVGLYGAEFQLFSLRRPKMPSPEGTAWHEQTRTDTDAEFSPC